jgi:chitodextrinase
MADEPSYGSPMGVEVPGQTTRQRPSVKPPDPEKVKAAMASVAKRAQGEARRTTDVPVGEKSNQQGAKPTASGTKPTAVQNIYDRKAAEDKAIDEQSG